MSLPLLAPSLPTRDIGSKTLDHTVFTVLSVYKICVNDRLSSPRAQPGGLSETTNKARSIMRGKVAPALSEDIQFGDPLNGRGRVSRSSVPAAIGSVKFYPPKVWPAMFWMSVVPAPRFPRTKTSREQAAVEVPRPGSRSGGLRLVCLHRPGTTARVSTIILMQVLDYRYGQFVYEVGEILESSLSARYFFRIVAVPVAVVTVTPMAAAPNPLSFVSVA